MQLDEIFILRTEVFSGESQCDAEEVISKS